MQQLTAYTLEKTAFSPLVPVYKAGNEAEIMALAAKFEPKIAAKIVEAFQKLAGQIDEAALIAALQSGNADKVLSVLGVGDLNDIFSPVKNELNATAWAGGLAAAQMPVFTRVKFVFNTLDPSLVTRLQNYGYDLIRETTATIREGVKQNLVAGFLAGTGPKQMATDIKNGIGLTAKQMQAVSNFRKQLETFHNKNTAGAWGIGKKPNKVNGTQVNILDGDGYNTDGIDARRLRDFRYDKQLAAALESGAPLTQEQIDKMVAAYYRKYVAYRARTIARTESARATNIGWQTAFEQAVKEQKMKETSVVRQWIVAKDERLCKHCAPVPKMNKKGVGLGQPFNTPKGPVMLPPLHPNCRCTVFIRSTD